jgi:hypothetical protein
MLRFPDPPGLACALGREEPAVWVRRILIWQDATAEPTRDIELKRGLNIIWSPTGPDALAAGHAAGKTMLCRLLRYCLGEPAFADPEDTAAIRAQFPDGAVGAEVRLRGQTWVVRRKFGGPRDDQAAKADGFEALSDENSYRSFGAFRDELEEIIFDDDQRRLLAEMDDVQGAWQYVLAWLTRDQECRIDGLTNWRHQESSSHSPVRNAGVQTRMNVLRVAIGLYSEGSSAARKEVMLASRRADAAKAVADRAEIRFKAFWEELATALGVDAEVVWPPPVEVLQDEHAAQDAHRQSLMALADHRIRGTGAVPTDPAHARDEEQMGLVAGELGRTAQEVANLDASIERQREHCKLLQRESAQRWEELRESKHPACPYDGTPLDVDKARFACPLPRLPDPAAAQRIAADTEATRQKILANLLEAERQLAVLRGKKASLETNVAALRRKIDANQHAVAAATHASQAAWATKGMVRRLFELWTQTDDALRVDSETKEALRKAQNGQVAGLSAFSTAELERWFDFLVRRVVSPQANGTVVLDGNGLAPKINWRGTRRSVALNSLQIVLFDLAAMLCAVEGDSRAPAFLVHDSPREGDLDQWTYARIFEALFELGPDEKTAPFQYIVTTTTDPPEGRVRSRVRLQIAADADENRLFRVDL